jgi:hypothetical protein
MKELLENKGYRGFKRFDPTQYSSILNVSDTMKEFYTEIAIFIKDLSLKTKIGENPIFIELWSKLFKSRLIIPMSPHFNSFNLSRIFLQ